MRSHLYNLNSVERTEGMAVAPDSLQVSKEVVQLIGGLGGVQGLGRTEQPPTRFWGRTKAGDILGWKRENELAQTGNRRELFAFYATHL